VSSRALLLVVFALVTPDLRSSSEAPLADAVERREFDRAAKLLAEGADVNAAQVDGMTALHWAVAFDHAKTVKALLAAGAKVGTKNRYDVSPLSLACEAGNAELVGALLDAGASVKAALPGGETPLLTASRSGSVEVVRALLDKGAEIDVTERRGQTALMWAAAEGHTDVVRLLVERKAEVDIRLRSGFTAFLFAVREGHIDVVRALLAAGVDVHQSLQPGRPSGSGAWKKAGAKETSALLLAIENAHFELALELLKAGANPNDMSSGRSPLHAIAGARKTERGDGANGNPPPEGSGRVTSLEFVEHIVKRGAKIDQRIANGKSAPALVNMKGVTPFLLAAKNADVPLMLKLLDLGADPTVANVENCTPFHAAAGMGVRAPGEEPGTEVESLEAMKLLLELGADIDAVDRRGNSAMHCAAYKSAPNIVRFLVENGAKIEIWNRKNKRGWTPLVIAQGFRPGNFKPAPDTIAAIEDVMRAAGVTPPPPPPRRRR